MVDRSCKANILGSTSLFKKKRYPDGLFDNFKARLCVRGDQEVDGTDVFDIFTPVVSWMTVHLLFVISTILNLNKQQVDYTNAFCQVPLEETVYVELPVQTVKQGPTYEEISLWITPGTIVIL